MSNAVATIGLALSEDIAAYLKTALLERGYRVYIAPDSDAVQLVNTQFVIDAWIFDARTEAFAARLLRGDYFLLPADNIPNPDNARPLQRWVEALLAQLAVALDASDATSRRAATEQWRQVRAVWLLAGSAGATRAIQDFLSAFDTPPPVAFLYAQHIAPEQSHQLEHFTLASPGFTFHFANGVQSLAPASVLMVSPKSQIAISRLGQVSRTRLPWQGDHTPDINTLMRILCAAQLPAFGVIVFSGMGNDGAAALPEVAAAGGKIWVQSPDTAVCAGMPEAALQPDLVHKNAAPEVLAAELAALYSAQ